MKPHQHGFTLLELMIAIVIIGILAAVAYPGYQNQIRRARRADAQGDLMAFAALMERSFTARNNYFDNGTLADINGNGIPDTGSAPAGIGFPLTSPMSGGPAVYNLTILAVGVAGNTYTLQATPIPGPQVTDGILTLTSAGQRWWDQNNNGAVDAGENTWDQ